MPESTKSPAEVLEAAGPNAGLLTAAFRDCLLTMSHSRAGWDYSLSREQRAKEEREEREALSRARVIWAENPALHEHLRTAFTAASPLATMREIEIGTQASIRGGEA